MKPLGSIAIWCIILSLCIAPLEAVTRADSAFLALQCELIAKQRWTEKPFGALVALVAQLFLGKPYRAGTLDSLQEETCYFTSDAFDCVTLTESALALARIARSGRCNYGEFMRQLEFIRYRRGKLDGYLSRLHYTTDWIRDNSAKHVIEDMTASMGGRSFKKRIDFMSTNPALYPQLRDSAALVPKIAAIERRLSRQPLRILPLAEINRVLANIQSGDIIAIATSKPGLDYAHIGIALRSGGKIHLIHASSKSGTVTLEQNLEQYLRSYPNATGISVLRPLDPQVPHHRGK
ncbi:MAG: DUF1460 domain-containing protein [Bacteroidota bacterium]|nr:DUF1460 domain-containing protein [Chlorobiota bacterium]MDW8074263.1 DUF1460 domain-containing protein [Bacteroidota bacterium]